MFPVSRAIPKGLNVPVCGREKTNPEPTVTTHSAKATNENSKSAWAKYTPPGSSRPVSAPLRVATRCTVRVSAVLNVTDPPTATDSLTTSESDAAALADMSRNVPGSGTSASSSV
jgi:hypothetical protein